MKYIGIPTCPYCKKKINLVRVWSVKKHGEFMCPRCKGISNIFLSPLIYVMAVLAISASFIFYFFQKFVSDNLSLWTLLQVFFPFAAFFFVSLFMVYLEKPVIKRVKKTSDGRYYDQNGNELRMRMGKLVSAAKPAQGQNFNDTAAMYTANDMTGRDEGKDSAPISLNLAHAEFAGDEAMYADTADKPSKEFTTEFNPKSLHMADELPEPKNLGVRPLRQEEEDMKIVGPDHIAPKAEAPVRRAVVSPEPAVSPAVPVQPVKAPKAEAPVRRAVVSPEPAVSPATPVQPVKTPKAEAPVRRPIAAMPEKKAEPVQMPKPFTEELAPEITSKTRKLERDVVVPDILSEKPQIGQSRHSADHFAGDGAQGEFTIKRPAAPTVSETPRPRVRQEAPLQEDQGNLRPVSGLDDLFAEYNKRIADEEKTQKDTDDSAGSFRKL